MKVLLLGPNGAVGRIVLDDLLKSDHDTKALVRNVGTMPLKHPRLSQDAAGSGPVAPGRIFEIQGSQ